MYLNGAVDDAQHHVGGKKPVSYTHLDVYKRQNLRWGLPTSESLANIGPSGFSMLMGRRGRNADFNLTTLFAFYQINTYKLLRLLN